jgi:hypothetical protein
MRLIDAEQLKQLRDDVISGKADIRTEGDLIDACPTVNPYEWISVKDRLPENAETVLALCKDGGMFVGRHTSWGRWEIWTAMKSTRVVSRTVTHWMLLPAPPTEKEN